MISVKEFTQFMILPGIILLVLDGVFLYMNRNMFHNQIMAVQGSPIRLKPEGAVICYIFLVIGLYAFILRDRRSETDAALFGLVVYGVYESTTYTLLNKWRFSTMILDTSWGAILCGLTTFFTYRILKLV